MISRDNPKAKEINGRPTKLIDFAIEDLEHNKLPCTLWGNFVDEMMSFLNTIGDEPVIVILQMYRARRYKGEVGVTNTFYISKLILNGKFEEVNEFRHSALRNSMSSMSLPSATTIVDELNTSKDIFRTIEQLSENDEVESFWVTTKIVSVESKENWWYLACKKCPKKLNAVGSRCKLELLISLEMQFSCIELLGKSALELKTEMENQMPKYFEFIADRNVLFKVQVRANQIRGYNGIYTVIKIVTDPKIVEKYAEELFESQESDLFSKLKRSETGDMEVLSSEDEVSTPIKSTGKTVISPDSLKNSTLKRALMDEFSSTSMEKKLKASIKQEKD
ncbi:uncharacterized protein [Henckelia pumila]|uniref:uncharacterized protein n=1 Tax=Henckelia pumila TaxID=405737 RepID=UPI003C6E5FE1